MAKDFVKQAKELLGIESAGTERHMEAISNLAGALAIAQAIDKHEKATANLAKSVDDFRVLYSRHFG